MRILKRILKRSMIGLFLAGLITGSACLFSSGQSINEYQKLWQDNKFGYFADDQKDNLFSNADFHQYARIRDAEFTEYLKETWQDYSIYTGLSDEPRNSLVKQPVFDYSDIDMTPPVKLPFSSVVELDNHGNGQIRSIPRIRKPESDDLASVKGGFLFYGQQISIKYDKLLLLSKTNSVSEDSVSGFWESFSRSNSNHLADQLMDYRDLLGLGDWGYFQLVKAASGHIFKENRWSSDLLTWALMIRSGFDVRLAFNQNSSTVLFPSDNTIYSRQFVMMGQKRFYLDREMNSQLLVTCRNPYPDTERMIDLKFYRSLNFNGKLSVRKFLYTWNKKNYEFTLRINPNTIRFYNDYPQTDPVVYFGAPVTSTLKEDLLGQLHLLLSEMDKAEAVVFLQQLVQREFNYAAPGLKDGKNPGCFAEEMIASGLGDDKGKAVLFSWFIRILLRLPVVGVHFPGYYTVAVSFDEGFEGDSYYLNRMKYLIADPTFQNAPIGVMIPELAGITPQLIDLYDAEYYSYRSEKIWELALKLGALRGGTGQDVVIDREGKALITGYFTGKRSYSPFIACFAPGNSLQWIRKFECKGKAVALAITKVSNDEIYLAGSFSGNMAMEGNVLQCGSRNADLFIAQFNQSGRLIWMRNAGIDSIMHDESSGYLVKFDRSGDHISVQLSNEDERNIRTGFGDLSLSEHYFTCSRNSTPGLVPFSWGSSSSDIIGEISKESNFLPDKKCHPKVAGVFAVMKLLQKSGAEITGNKIQSLLTKHNPSFQNNYPSLFKAIGQVEHLKNENGIVSVRMIGNQSIVLNNFRIENGARFNISGFDNGDLSVGTISGFQKVIKLVELPVNSFLFDCSSGNLMVDYDNDHTLKTLSSGVIGSAK